MELTFIQERNTEKGQERFIDGNEIFKLRTKQASDELTVKVFERLENFKNISRMILSKIEVDTRSIPIDFTDVQIKNSKNEVLDACINGTIYDFIDNTSSKMPMEPISVYTDLIFCINEQPTEADIISNLSTDACDAYGLCKSGILITDSGNVHLENFEVGLISEKTVGFENKFHIDIVLIPTQNK